MIHDVQRGLPAYVHADPVAAGHNHGRDAADLHVPLGLLRLAYLASDLRRIEYPQELLAGDTAAVHIVGHHGRRQELASVVVNGPEQTVVILLQSPGLLERVVALGEQGPYRRESHGGSFEAHVVRQRFLPVLDERVEVTTVDAPV